jgi:flagellar assembly factor FliW
MANCRTKYFGEMTYEPGAVWRFPLGLPGFETEREFLPIEQPATQPLVYLQSLSTTDVCFTALPAYQVVENYRLEMSDEDRALIGIDATVAVGPASERVLCLALVTIRETGATANLMAPVVANLGTGLAVQAVSPAGGYSHQHALGG